MGKALGALLQELLAFFGIQIGRKYTGDLIPILFLGGITALVFCGGCVALVEKIRGPEKAALPGWVTLLLFLPCWLGGCVIVVDLLG